MMVDDFENKQFTQLLKSYSEPVLDGGFSAGVLVKLPAPRARQNLKRQLILGASVLGALIAGPQMLKLKTFIGSVKLPELALPEIGLIGNMSYTMAALSLLIIVMVWIGGTLILGD